MVKGRLMIVRSTVFPAIFDHGLKIESMKNRLLAVSICLLATYSSFAQYQLNGHITDEEKVALLLATVALYQAADSTLATATSTDERGRFLLKDIPAGQYYLQVSMIGYQQISIADIQLPAQHERRFELRMESSIETLGTVEVTAQVPLLEQRADRLIVNVEHNLRNLNSNLLDVMKQVPGMIVVNSRLRMAGQANFTILIDGKTTRYMDVQSLLRDMPGDNVKRVEVIHQPGAEFEAAGTGPIINIILKKNSLYGTNGRFSVGLGKDYGWIYTPSLSLSHYQGNVNLNGGIGYSRYAFLEDLLITRRIQGDIYDQRSFDPPRSGTFRANFSADWDIDQAQRLGIASRYSRNRTSKVAENTTKIDFLAPEETDLDLFSRNTGRSSWDFVSLNPYYHYQLDTSGHKIEFDFNYVSLLTDGYNSLQTEERNEGSFFAGQQFSQPGDVAISATRLDYHYPLSKALRWQLGGKYSQAKLDNNLQSSIETTDGSWVNNPLQSNHFIFDEKIAAAYTKLSFDRKGWSGTLGLRLEDSRSEGYSMTLDSSLQRNISKLFPSLSIGRDLTDQLNASVAYSYRIERPQYSSLNPFVYYWDPYTYEKGNPLLVPALTHSTRFNLSYEGQPFFNAEYKTTAEAMVEVTEQNDATGEAYTTVVNLASQQLFNTSLYFPLDFLPGIEGFGGLIASHTSFDSEYLDQQFLQSGWSFTAFLEASFELPGEIETELSGWYNSGGPEGIMDAECLYGVSLGFGKDLWKEKAHISLGIEDIFNRFWHARIDYANMDVDVVQRWYRPNVSMRFTYKFGNQHIKRKEQHRGSASDEINRVQ